MESSVEIRLLQDLLRRPEVAVIVNMRLENTSWTASRIARFLSTQDPDTPRKDGAQLTWFDLYEDLNNTFTTISELTKVLEPVYFHLASVQRHWEEIWCRMYFILTYTFTSLSYKLKQKKDSLPKNNKLITP